MPTEQWESPAAIASVLTTELNALADGSFCAAGAAVDNAADLDRFGQAELTVDFVSAPTDRSVCELFLVPSLDGTNFAEGGGSDRPSEDYYAGSFQLQAVTAAQRVVSGIFQVPPFKFKPVLYNRSGQAFPATGSIVRLRKFNRTVT